jgi:hypothetical protein
MRFKLRLACVRFGPKQVKKKRSLTHFPRFDQGEFSSALAGNTACKAQFKPVMN